MARKNDILSIYSKEVEDIKAAGLFKGEVPIVSPQSAKVKLEDGRTVINMCANNYLGLGDNQRLIDAAKRTYDERGYGVASVRFICGTQDIHKQLEKKISSFLGTDDTILYSSCFDANGGLFETILTADDAVISDELNHASIIDGIRLCKAKRFRYKNNNMEDLEAKLKEADEAGARIKLIATDGVFSMDGIICNLKGVCDLADKYNALVMVDDSHAVGFVGKHAAPQSTAALRAVLTSSPAPWAKHWAAHPAATPPDAKRSSTCSDREAVHTCSPTPWLQPLQAPASRCSTCLRRAPLCATTWRRSPLTTATCWSKRASTSSQAPIHAYRS